MIEGRDKKGNKWKVTGSKFGRDKELFKKYFLYFWEFHTCIDEVWANHLPFPPSNCSSLLSSCPLLNSTPFFLMTRYVQLLLPTGIHVSPANGAWKTYKKPHPQKGMNRLPSATINCQQFLSPGWGLEIVYPIYTGMLAVLSSCWFCARNHSCCGFEHNGHILSRRRQPTGLLPIPCFLPSFRLLFSKALWALVMMGNNVEIWLEMDNWSDSQHLIRLCI